MLQPPSRIRGPLLALASLALLAVGLEVGSRAWIAYRWPAGRARQLLAPLGPVAGYVFDPQLGYRLEPDRQRTDATGKRFRHNHLGVRGPEISRVKPKGVRRILLLGDSTVYGPYVDETETSAAQLQQRLAQGLDGARVQVVNAGVPGWTSRETRLNLLLHLAELSPDALVVMEGRNELFPELFRSYRSDYSHYRRIGYDYRRGNRIPRRLFRWSRAWMLLSTRHGERLGYSSLDERPPYAYVRWENLPDESQIAALARRPGILEGFRRNLEADLDFASARGILAVLASIPFRVEGYRSGVIRGSPRIYPVLSELMRRNNALTRAIAAERGVPFVDGASLSRARYLVDDCHLNADGERELARLFARALEPLLGPRARARGGAGEGPSG